MNTLSLALQTSALISDFVGALLFAKATIKGKAQIKAISGTYFNENRSLETSLLEDRNLGLAGLCCLCIGFVLQIIGIMTAMF